MAKLLIVDGDASTRRIVGGRLEEAGHHVATAETITDGLSLLGQGEFDLVLLYDRLPDGAVIEAATDIVSREPAPEVIVWSDHPDPAEAERVIRAGAWDYMDRGRLLRRLVREIEAINEYRRSKEDPAGFQYDDHASFEAIIGRGPEMHTCLIRAMEAARSSAHVLLTGETGTGKGLFARAIHRASDRAGHNFVVVDCTTLPETLVESVLFGHHKGAFTGAHQDRPGLIKQADGGTLFLDEVGELDLSIQRRFLRVLDEGMFRPVGSRDEETSRFRMIAATHRNLKDMVRAGTFRQDLFFRLEAFTIDLPPLRRHPEDIEALARHQVELLCRHYGIPAKKINREFIDALRHYHWPGNVRELINALERSIAVSWSAPTLYTKSLPLPLRVTLARRAAERFHGFRGPSDHSDGYPSLKDFRRVAVETAERQYLRDLMDHTSGDMGQAVSLSGLSRSRLYHLLKRHHIDKD